MTESAPLPLAKCGVLIAGGTAGVGLATAVQFAEAGVTRIALIGRNPERGEAARAKLAARFPQARVAFIAADANDAAAAQRAGEEAEQLVGPIDVLVNSTNTMFVPTLFQEVRTEDVLPTVAEIMMPALHMCSVMLPKMRERRRGVIVNIASDAGKVPTPGEAAIGAAMAGICMFSRTLAMEAKRFGVRVNAITPSLIGGTGSYAKIMDNEFAGKLFQKAQRAAHLGLTMPEDIAPLIVYIASPQGARMTGQVISVNGGISAA
jgi:2-hydroxycyclohexanecarboxyl-CoA dehydrogenase